MLVYHVGVSVKCVAVFDTMPSWGTLASGVVIGAAVVVVHNHFPLFQRGGPYLPVSYRFGLSKFPFRFGIETCHKELLQVFSVFKSSFEKGHNSESQLCIFSNGEKVLDVFGCPCDNKDYDSHTLQTVFSCTKVASATVIALLVDR